MKGLSTYLDEYLELRHKLGFRLRLAGGLLRRFVLFAQAKRASFITRKLAVQWATQPNDCQPSQWANRLGMVRRFAQHVSGTDPRTEIPPQELLPHRYHRKPPYLYSDREVRRLIQTARQLPSPDDLRAASHATLFGLLAVTGMRVGEAIGLDRADVDLQQGILTVRQAKFGKSRLLPVHVTTQKQLRAYARLRDRVWPRPSAPAFFISQRGTRLTDCTVRRWPAFRNYAKEQPVSDQTFQVYRGLFTYDKTELNARTEAIDDTPALWRKETVSFAAAYGSERVTACVFLPKKSTPPFQAVVNFPGAGAIFAQSSREMTLGDREAAILEQGRALIYPIYKGTFERADGLRTDCPASTSFYRDHVIQWAKDLGRTIDYLETRSDIRRDKLADCGGSWGAAGVPRSAPYSRRSRPASMQAS